jgi:fucose 4-O-acetylase-like acetyltransferase
MGPCNWGGTELVILLLIASGIQNPSVVSSIYICKLTLPLLPILMFGGSCLIIYLAKLIKINRVLECLGRNSLMIYLFHFIFLQALIMYICKDPQFRNPTNSLRSLRSKPPRMRFLLFKLAFCHVLTDMIV